MRRTAHTLSDEDILQLIDSTNKDYDAAADALAEAEHIMTMANIMREHCYRALEATDPSVRHKAREAIATQWNDVFET